MPFPPNFDHVWDLTQPSDTQLLNQGALDFRSLKDDVMQRMSLLSGTIANRPTPEIVNATWGGVGFGLLYFSTDTSQIFQWNGVAWIDITPTFTAPPIRSGGTNGSTFVVANTIPLVAQQADIPLTTLYTVPLGSGGLYRVSYYIVQTQRATNSGQLPNGIVIYTDPDTSTGISLFITNQNPANLVGAVGGINTSSFGISAGSVINAKPGTNIAFQTSGYASSGVTPLQFSFRARLEYLG